MPDLLTESLDTLRGLGRPAEMWSLAEKGHAPAARPKVNIHIHLPPNFSAFDSVPQTVQLADAQDVRVVGVTNYYDYAVYGDFAARARDVGIFPLFGLEVISLLDDLVRDGTLINDPNNPGRMYLCGKGTTGVADPSPRAAELLGTIRRNDTERMAEITRRVEALFAEAGLETGLNDEAIIDRIVARHGCRRDSVTLQERHVAMAFQEVLFDRVPTERRREFLSRLYGGAEPKAVEDPVKVQGKLRGRLIKSGGPAFVPETFLPFDEAYELVLALGGIPCYPTLADGAEPICPYEDPPEKLIKRLHGRNIHMAEFIPVRNTPQVLVRYVRGMRSAGIAVVAGTEHNTLDLLPLEPACAGGAPIGESLKDIFWEGACVVAAHQFLRLHGEAGFVDGDGKPNAHYPTADERIAAFAGLGAAVIQRYFEACRGKEA